MKTPSIYLALGRESINMNSLLLEKNVMGLQRRDGMRVKLGVHLEL